MNTNRLLRWTPLGVLLLTFATVAQSVSTDSGPYKTYLGNRDQFTIELPDGWHVVDQSPFHNFGVIAFYSQPLDITFDKGPAIRQQQEEAFHQLLTDMSSGALPTFFADRYKADKGMRCEGFDKRAQDRKLKIFSQADALGRKPKLIGKPEIADVDFGGCKGVRVLLRATNADGQDWQMLVYSAAVNGITYDFALLTITEYFARNLTWFERAIASVRLVGAGQSTTS